MLFIKPPIKTKQIDERIKGRVLRRVGGCWCIIQVTFDIAFIQDDKIHIVK
jgi:hypothetical protein